MTPARVLLACLLSAAYAKPDKSDEHVVYTYNDDGSVDKDQTCVFPFYYNGKKYTKCTKDDAVHANAFWCATSKDFKNFEKGNWGYCLGLRYMNNGPNPRDYATCSMNGWGDVTTVTFDDSNLVFNNIDKCQINLVHTEAKFGDGDRYTGFQVIVFTTPKYQKSYVHRVDVKVFDQHTKAWTEISVRRKDDDGQVVINGQLIKREVLEKGHSLVSHDTIHIGYRKGLKTVIIDIDNQARVMYRFEGAWDRHHVNCLLFDKFYERKLTGMCGTADSNPRNDYFAKDGNKFDVNKREVVNTWLMGACEEVDED